MDRWLEALGWGPKATDERATSSKSECRTYRIHEVPLQCDETKLENFLNEEPGKTKFKVKSLALEYHGWHRTATVDASDGAELPTYIDIPSDTSWVADSKQTQLQTDDDFDGFTTLFAPPEDEHKVDVIAICGLGGHAIGSFRHKKSHHIWLRDSLPQHLKAEHSGRPMARLMTYGYESKVAESNSTQHFGDLAADFREILGALEGKRPLIFIAHSLGGLIVKETIISLHKSEKTEHQMLLRRIYGIIFFAVPHAGLKIDSMVSMVGGGYNLGLIVSLSNVTSKVLDDQRREFNQALGKDKDAEVFCFFEQLPSPTAIEVAKGEWKMKGPEEILLDKTSATHCRSWEDGPEHVCPIRASHSDIVKFMRNDPGYTKALQKIKGVCHRALGAREIAPSSSVQFAPQSFMGREETLRRIEDTSRVRSQHQPRHNSRYEYVREGGHEFKRRSDMFFPAVVECESFPSLNARKSMASRAMEEEACLRSLAFEQLGARQHDIEPALAGTCDWLFATPEFVEWCDRDRLAAHHGVLWVKGKPGAGKSTLMKHAFQYCQDHFSDHRVAAYFFNARGGTLEKSPLGMLKSIIYQLVQKDEDIFHLFMPLYDEKQRLYNGSSSAKAAGLVRQWEWSVPELRDFLLEMIKLQGIQGQNASRRPLLLLIDALDECCEEGARSVVKVLETLSGHAVEAKVTLRICLSSRHYPSITMQKHLPLEVGHADGHSQDITAYISDKLAGGDTELEAEVRNKSGGVFLWVVIVIEQLNIAYENGIIEAMWEVLESVPDDVEKIFESLVSRDDGDRYETVLALQWVLLSERPLYLDELYLAITGIDQERGARTGRQIPADVMQRRVNAVSRGLIELRKHNDEDSVRSSGESQRSEVQFIHLSVNDFLFRQGRLSKLDRTLGPNPVCASHGRLWAFCWRFMEHCIQQQQSKSPEKDPDFEARWQSKRDYPFLIYAVDHILAHADKAMMPVESSVLEIGDGNTVTEVELQSQVVAWLKKQAKWFPWWIKFTEAVGNRKRSQDVLADTGLVFVLSLHGYGNLLRTALLTGELQYQVNANAQGQNGVFGAALCAAARKGNREIVQQLLEAGADINLQVQVGDYGTALCAAAWRGKREIVRQLLEAGADINLQAQVSRYGTALCAAAAWGGEREIVRQLLEAGADVNLQAQVGDYGTALCAAAWRGQREIVRQLLEAGADINLQAQVSRYGTALCAAAAGVGVKDTIRELLEAGADVNLQAQVGDYGTALCAAAAGVGVKDTIRELLEAGADVNLQAQVGDYGTALCAAAWRGQREIVRQLLEAGADINLQAQVSRYGTALCAAAAGVGVKDTIRELLEAGADINLQAQVGDYGTALCAAAWRGKREIVRQLLEAGADINLQARTNQSSTALCVAEKQGHTDIVQFLRDAGAHDPGSANTRRGRRPD